MNITLNKKMTEYLKHNSDTASTLFIIKNVLEFLIELEERRKHIPYQSEEYKKGYKEGLIMCLKVIDRSLGHQFTRITIQKRIKKERKRERMI